MQQPDPRPRVVKKVDKSQNRDIIPADRRDAALRTLKHIESQAGRLQHMAREVITALTTK